jgi:hypothetical protein
MLTEDQRLALSTAIRLTSFVIPEYEVGRQRWDELHRALREKSLAPGVYGLVMSMLEDSRAFGIFFDASYDDYCLASVCVEMKCLDITPWLLGSTRKGRSQVSHHSSHPLAITQHGPYIGMPGALRDQAAPVEEHTSHPLARLCSIVFDEGYPNIWASYLSREVLDWMLTTAARLAISSASSLPTAHDEVFTAHSRDEASTTHDPSAAHDEAPTTPSFFMVAVAILAVREDQEYRRDFLQRAQSLLITSAIVEDLSMVGCIHSLYLPSSGERGSSFVDISPELATRLHHRHPLPQATLEQIARHYVRIEANPIESIQKLAVLGLDLRGLIAWAAYRGGIPLIKWLWDQGYRPRTRTVAAIIVKRGGDYHQRLRELDEAGIPPVVPRSQSRDIDPRYIIGDAPNLQQRLIDMGQLEGEKSEEEVLVKSAATRVVDEDE